MWLLFFFFWPWWSRLCILLKVRFQIYQSFHFLNNFKSPLSYKKALFSSKIRFCHCLYTIFFSFWSAIWWWSKFSWHQKIFLKFSSFILNFKGLTLNLIINNSLLIDLFTNWIYCVQFSHLIKSFFIVRFS